MENEKSYLLKRLQEVEYDLSSYAQPEKKGIKETKILPQILSFKNSGIYHLFHQWSEGSAKITGEQWKELQAAIDLTYPRFTDRLLTLHPQTIRDRATDLLFDQDLPPAQNHRPNAEPKQFGDHQRPHPYV